MADHIHYAAHVDHPIAHSSEIGRLTLGLGAVAIAAIVIVGTGGGAAILTFAAAGRPLDPLPARPGEYVPSTLAFYPGALPMRALLTQTDQRRQAPRPLGHTVQQALVSYVESLAADPWNERWPLVLHDVRPARNGDGWALVDEAGDGLEILPGWDPLKLLAVSAGDPVTVAAEWNRAGLRPMTCWRDPEARSSSSSCPAAPWRRRRAWLRASSPAYATPISSMQLRHRGACRPASAWRRRRMGIARSRTSSVAPTRRCTAPRRPAVVAR